MISAPIFYFWHADAKKSHSDVNFSSKCLIFLLKTKNKMEIVCFLYLKRKFIHINNDLLSVQPFVVMGQLTRITWYLRMSMQFYSVLLGSILVGDILGTNFDQSELGRILFLQFCDNFGYFGQNNVFNQTNNSQNRLCLTYFASLNP